MLSTITAAETQFHRDDDRRSREFALLASIRERRAAESGIARVAPMQAAVPRAKARAAWARPIRVASAAPPAVACA